MLRSKSLSVGVSGVLIASLFGTGIVYGSSASSETSPSSRNPVNITVEIFDRGNVPASQGTVTNNYWTRWIQSQMLKQGVKVTFIPVPRSQSETKLNVMMETGTAPDLVYTYLRDPFLNYAAQGGLWDLADLMKKYGSQIVSHEGNSLNYGKINGRIYAVPGVRATPGWIVGWIRKDWLDKLGLPLPKNRDQLVADLKLFKEKDPGGVGKENVIPWGGNFSFDKEYLYSPENSFMQNVPASYFSAPQQLRPGFKNFAKWMNVLYHEGLVDPQFSTRNLTSNAQLGSYYKDVGYFQEGWWVPEDTQPNSILNLLRGSDPHAQLVPVDPFPDSHGKYFQYTYAPVGLYNMVPKTCKHPEAVVKYLNFMAQSSVSYYLEFGIKGKNHTIKNGIPVAIDPALNSQTMAVNGDLDILNNGYNFPDLPLKALDEATYGKEYGDLAYQAYEASMKDAVPYPTFTKPLQSLIKYGAQLDTVYTQDGVKLMEASNFDQSWNSFMNDVNANGGQHLTKEMSQLFKKGEVQ